MGDRKRPAEGDGREERNPKRQFSNDYVMKMLCPGRCAGAIIGTGGEKIKMLKEETGANVKVTKNRENFPGTDERVVTVSGSLKALQDCIIQCQDLIRNDKPPEGVAVKGDSKRKEQLIIVVAGTSAGRIIGKAGSKVNQLRKDYNVNIDVTKPENLIYGLNENPVTITGSDEDINNCIKEVVELIMEDKNASMKWNVDYLEFANGAPIGDRRSYNRGDNSGYGGDRESYSERGSYGDRRGYSSDRGGYGDDRRGYSTGDRGSYSGDRQSYGDDRRSYGRNDYDSGYGGASRGGYDSYNRSGYDNYGSSYNDSYSGGRDYKSGGGSGYDSQGASRNVSYPPPRSSGGYDRRY